MWSCKVVWAISLKFTKSTAAATGDDLSALICHSLAAAAGMDLHISKYLNGAGKFHWGIDGAVN